MLALDQRASFRKIVNLINPTTVSDQLIIQFKSEIIASLHDQLSGLLIDPIYGLPAYQSLQLSTKKPYILCIERSGYEEQEGERLAVLAYTVGQLKDKGASGIKLDLSFNPYSPHAQEQIEIVKGISTNCKKFGTPFFLQIVTYPYQEHNQKYELISACLEMFLREKIFPDIFQLEYPGDAASCKKVTRLLGKTPWIILTLGIPYEFFKHHLEIACFNGCSGFLAGRSIWQEIGQAKTSGERKKFLSEVAAKRFKEISQIVMKNSFLV